MLDEQTHYEITVMPPDERCAIINERKKEPEHLLPFTDLPTGPEKLPVFYVPIELLLYRMQNARTRSWQRSLVLREDRDSAFFEEGQENLEAQESQHSRLVELAREGNTKDQKDIWEALQAAQRQTEPLLITADGIVVNGNRRLAAMRELIGEIPSFRKVLVHLLPSHLEERDFREIEAKLQMAVDYRLKYEWTDEAQLAQDLLRDNDGDYARVEDILGYKKGDVDKLIRRYEESQLFLVEAMDSAEDFEYVNGRKQDFIQIAAATEGVEDAREKDVVRLLAWHLTKQAEDNKGRRLYEYDVVYRNERRADTLEMLAERLAVDLDELDNDDTDDDDLFEDPAEDNSLANRFGPVISVLKETLRDDKKSQEIAEHLREIGDEFILLDKDKKSKNVAIKKAKNALAMLKTIKPERSTPELRAELISILDSVHATVDGLKTLIDKIDGRGQN